MQPFQLKMEGTSQPVSAPLCRRWSLCERPRWTPEEVTECARMVASRCMDFVGVHLGPELPTVYALEQHAPLLLAFLRF
eukprot:11915388-Prorocentrum_lima.AAC.1